MTIALAITCAISIAILAALLASQPEPRHRMPEPPLHARAAMRLRLMSAAFIAAQILRYQLATPTGAAR